MVAAITFLHIMVCFFIIGVVLLQSGKGAEMGASFGSGGSQSVFGASGGATFLTKLTATMAVIFMLTCLSLAYFSGHSTGSSIMSSKAAQKAVPSTPVPNTPPVGPIQGAPVKP